MFIEADAPVMDRARWGLVPACWKQPKLPPFTFNSRIEEAATKPMWREPLKKSRCLVPAMGWYEWKEAEKIDPATGEVKKVKQPYFIHLAAKKLIHFAGLMSKRRAENEQGYELSCSIMTKEAEGPATEVHTHTPVILPQPAH